MLRLEWGKDYSFGRGTVPGFGRVSMSSSVLKAWMLLENISSYERHNLDYVVKKPLMINVSNGFFTHSFLNI